MFVRASLLSAAASSMLMTSGCGSTLAAPSSAAPAASERLVFADEFDAPTLDRSKWNVIGPDFWVNQEQQAYVDSPDTIRFLPAGRVKGASGGVLLLQPKFQQGFQTPTGRKADFVSGRISTQGKFDFTYGRAVARIRMPAATGVWPAFWLLPQSNVFGGWPRSGEIDLMEMVGHEPNKVYGTLHYGPGPGSTQISRSYTLPSGTFNDAFHVFSIEWQTDVIKWYIDGNLFSTAAKSDFGGNTYPFNEDFYLIFNLAVGGNWPGNPDASTRFPQYLVVDYVRVFK